MTIQAKLLERIVELAKKQNAIETELESLNKKVKEKSAELMIIQGGYRVEGALPSAMAEAEVDYLELTGGLIVSVKKELKPPSMAADSPNRQLVLEWVEKSGHGDLIADEVKIPFAKGDVRVASVVSMLEKENIQFGRYRTVNAQTLGAFIRELLEAGKEVPMQELGIMEFRKAKVSL